MKMGCRPQPWTRLLLLASRLLVERDMPFCSSCNLFSLSLRFHETITAAMRCTAAPTKPRSAAAATVTSTEQTGSPACTTASRSSTLPLPPNPRRFVTFVRYSSVASLSLSLSWGGDTGAKPPPCFLKEKRGLLFCQEDRAIFCRDCDVPIHSATALTMKHNRFLLTGLRVSAAPIEAEAVDSHRGGGMRANSSSSSSSSATAAATTNSNSSSISEYLIKMLPGWHVEDFLTDDAAVHALCKVNQRRFLLSFPVV
ncbi:hypothetical protein BHE74_00008823 [Ensete ventricosum]|nr:hypothetical protein BHE74_00008823 [Ensete ventricosum]